MAGRYVKYDPATTIRATVGELLDRAQAGLLETTAVLNTIDDALAILEAKRNEKEEVT